MNRLSTEDRTRAVACLVEGNSQRATCRMTGLEALGHEYNKPDGIASVFTKNTEAARWAKATTETAAA